MKHAVQYRLNGDTARAIARSVEDSIRQGDLAPGDGLPTVRSLATDLGVSPSTVANAYRELQRRGVLVGSGRRGTHVRRQPPVSSSLPMAVPPGVRDLRTGGPDPELLPPLGWSAITSRGYGDPPVSPRLAEVAGTKLEADGIDGSALAVVGGALDGVERVLGAWLHPGDRVIVEDPGYTAALDLLVALGMEVVPVGMDERGIRPDRLDAALARGADGILLTPRAQNPTGTAWDGSRAAELEAVLSRYPDLLVVEDDHAGPAAGAPAHTVCRARGRWATIRSVSKWLSPDLRLAVLAGDPTTVSRVEGRQALGAGWVSYLLQDTAAELWGSPEVGVLLAHAASVYADRRAALTDALAGRGLHSTGTSGLTTWVPVSDEQAVVSGLLQRGWAVSPGDRFRITSPAGIRISISTLDAGESELLAEALSDCIGQRPVRTD
ncbi:MAG: aminotransferase class I/II-fold pyridoxal phosphate-dependent enzyme [Acidimicrobiales bacterium]